MDGLRPGATAAPGRRLPAVTKPELAGQPYGKVRCSEVDWLLHALMKNGALVVGSSLEKGTKCPVNPIVKKVIY